MAQRLIVEGNDAIVLTQICIKQGMKPPKGYDNQLKYRDEFVKKANGIDQVNTVLVEELESDVANIGIIVDANEKGATARFDELKKTIEKTLQIELPTTFTLHPNGFCQQVMDNLTIGIWIMPDNQGNGYLEHFVGTLVKSGNPIWPFAEEKVNELMELSFCPFTAIKKQKALLHTYLAWQKTPGLPMGTAIKSGYLDAHAPLADQFITWFEKTFELKK